MVQGDFLLEEPVGIGQEIEETNKKEIDQADERNGNHY